jgi:hypothetical protein
MSSIMRWRSALTVSVLMGNSCLEWTVLAANRAAGYRAAI